MSTAPQTLTITRPDDWHLHVRDCAALALGEDGRMAFYSGDDAKGEYIYKFVPAGRFDAAKGPDVGEAQA